jgi:hypothetical protein
MADSILNPRLDWIIHSPSAVKLDAELSYVSGGLLWNADYNLAAPENGDKVDLTGGVTLQNQSGHQFEDARIKLVAGEVNKVRPADRRAFLAPSGGLAIANTTTDPFGIAERSFDEYHFYTLPRPTTIHDQETKQVEFLAEVQHRIRTRGQGESIRHAIEPQCLGDPPNFGILRTITLGFHCLPAASASTIAIPMTRCNSQVKTRSSRRPKTS